MKKSSNSNSSGSGSSSGSSSSSSSSSNDDDNNNLDASIFNSKTDVPGRRTPVAPVQLSRALLEGARQPLQRHRVPAEEHLDGTRGVARHPARQHGVAPLHGRAH